MQSFEEVLKFWFGEEPTQARKEWFVKDEKFDSKIRVQFLSLYQRASQGELATWAEDPQSLLALLIILDQFPRNMFRQKPESFVADALARQYAKKGLSKGFDQQVLPLQRVFYYLPFEHSEKIEDQEESVRLFIKLEQELPRSGFTDYAIKHAEIIKRFGRFPHRNAILKRSSTREEKEFLKTFSGF